MPRAFWGRFGWEHAAAGLGLVLLAVAVTLAGRGGAVLSETAGDAETADQALLFKTEGVRWIREQRDRHRPYAEPLEHDDVRRFAGYFPARILDSARVRVVERLENPEFFTVFEESGRPYPIDLSRASGLALIDTVVLTASAVDAPSRRELLFHELVHVLQYEVLGLDTYMDLYVDGWLEAGQRYRRIPHERQAFELSRRFRASEGVPFSVEQEVRRAFPGAPASLEKPGSFSPEIYPGTGRAAGARAPSRRARSGPRQSAGAYSAL